MGDSQLIIEYFNKEFNFDMNSHLSKQERAVAGAIQKWLEEYTYWFVEAFSFNILYLSHIRADLATP
jgi:hypothetical protein